MGLDAGSLRDRITLERKDRRVLDSGAEGGPWRKIATVHARPLDPAGREFFSAQQRYAEVQRVWEIRRRKGFTPVDRVTHAGRAYDVLAAVEMPPGYPDRIQIIAKARAE